MIKKLKKNEKVFSRLSKKDRELFKKVGTENCVRWSSHDGDWKLVLNDFVSDFVYRIHEDYQPETHPIPEGVLLVEWYDQIMVLKGDTGLYSNDTSIGYTIANIPIHGDPNKFHLVSVDYEDVEAGDLVIEEDVLKHIYERKTAATESSFIKIIEDGLVVWGEDGGVDKFDKDDLDGGDLWKVVRK